VKIRLAVQQYTEIINTTTIIIITIIKSIFPSGTYVCYKYSPSFSIRGNKPKIAPAALPASVSSP
jgi:hypothetical protein